MRFNKKEMEMLVSQVELEEGETTNIHHCKRGQNNDRCYISRKPECYLAYCHHCGCGGSLAIPYAKAKAARRDSKTSASRFTASPRQPSHDATTDRSEWSVKARAWFGRAGLTEAETSSFGYVFSNRDGRVWLPLYRGTRRVGWQGRAVEDGLSPKYLTYCSEDFAFLLNHNHSNVLVIVEDALSAIKVSLSTEYDVLALMGTSLTDYQRSLIVGEYDKYIIWLDNDNRQVKLKQVQLRDYLSMFGEVVLLKTDDDPKMYTKEKIEELLNET